MLNQPIKSFPFRIIILMLAVVGCHSAAWAGGQVCESVQSGAWEAPSTWSNCGGGIPDNNSSVVINSTHEVNLNGDTAAINDFDMGPIASLLINPVGGVTITVDAGDFDSRSGNLFMNGDLTIEAVAGNVDLGNAYGPASLLIDSFGTLRFYEVLDNTPLLHDLEAYAPGGIVSHELNVNGAITLHHEVTFTSFSRLSADHILIMDDVHFPDNFSIGTQGTSTPSEVNGILRGNGNGFSKYGAGTLHFNQASTHTGRVSIGAGRISHAPIIDSPFPLAERISLEYDNVQVGSVGVDWRLKAGQSLVGLGQILGTLITEPQSILRPIEPSNDILIRTEMFADRIEMQAGSTYDLNVYYDNECSKQCGPLYTKLTVDEAVLAGTLDLGIFWDPPTPGEEFIIIEVLGNNPVFGHFKWLPEGGIIRVSGYQFRISYQAGDGNDVSLRMTDVNDVIYVDTNAMITGTSHDGSSWEEAFFNLQDALAAAQVGNDIWVAAGVYYPDEGSGQVHNDPNSHFKTKSLVDVYGGFAGHELYLEARDVERNITILSGDLTQDDLNTDGNHVAEHVAHIRGNNAHHVIYNEGINGTVTTWDGLTITAGQANGTDEMSLGGGYFCADMQMRIDMKNMRFIGNQALGNGGAVANCSRTEFNGISFINNAANKGGAIYGHNYTMYHAQFLGNQSQNDGGAIFVNSGSVPGSVFLLLFFNEFAGNQSLQGNGGAIYAKGYGSITSRHSLFSGNRAVNGGAIAMDDTQLATKMDLTHATMTGNSASQQGGAIWVNMIIQFDLLNTVIWNNADASGVGTLSASIHDPNGVLDNQYSLIQGHGTAGMGNLDEDPLFVTDTDPNQAPTLNGNARLTAFSPALDAGFAYPTVLNDFDLDGRPRMLGDAPDMGAYESLTDLIFTTDFE